MKAVIVYYSHTGTTRRVSEAIAEELATVTDWQVELCEIKPEKEVGQGFSKYVWGGGQVVMKLKPQLMPYKFDTKADVVFLGTPVWAFSISPPISSFLSEQSLAGKQVFCYYTCQGGPGKTEDAFAREVGKEVARIEVYGFGKENLRRGEFEVEAKQWIRNIVERTGK